MLQVQDRVLLDLVEQLRQKIGMRNHVRVVLSGRDLGPCVIGLVWPTIVLPLALATGLPAEEMRAILAHELAHIRRHDTLWNLGQMLVESLLFFNPVVWWLGRQVRVEREACCDATAVALTGRPLDYSRGPGRLGRAGRQLARSAEGGRRRLGRPAATLLCRERILRIPRPGDRPRARISWGGLPRCWWSRPAVLFGLHRGTQVAVTLAAQVLAPAERLERLKVAQAEYRPLEQETPEEGQGKVTIKGTIRTPDGLPLPRPITASTITRSRNSTSMAAAGSLEGVFLVRIE